MTTENSSDAAGVDAKLARHGKISYTQLPALDVGTSGDFYAAVFGWDVSPASSPAHRSFTDASGEMAGAFVTTIAPADDGVLPYIYVRGIDAVVRTIEAAGGEIVRPVYAEGDLWVATFHDPAGNLIGVWQAGSR
jgi:predicted enzyme related to lactoylglutathione lyase